MISERQSVMRRMRDEIQRSWGFQAYDHLREWGTGYARFISFTTWGTSLPYLLNGSITIFSPTSFTLNITSPGGYETTMFHDSSADDVMNYLAEVRDQVRDAAAEAAEARNNVEAVARVSRTMTITYDIFTEEDHVRVQPEQDGVVSLSIINTPDERVSMAPEQVKQLIDALTMALDNIGEPI
jgi:hypothetical protein